MIRVHQSGYAKARAEAYKMPSTCLGDQNVCGNETSHNSFSGHELYEEWKSMKDQWIPQTLWNKRHWFTVQRLSRKTRQQRE